MQKKAGVFLHCRSHVLLVWQRCSGMVGIPKGAKSDGESNDDCWKRELLEETSIDISKYHYKIKNTFETLIYHITSVELDCDYLPNPHVGDENEIVKVMWVKYCDISKYALNIVTSHTVALYINKVDYCKGDYKTVEKVEDKVEDKYRHFSSCKKTYAYRYRHTGYT